MAQTLDSYTNNKGVTFRVGDRVVKNGSKTVRVIMGIYPPFSTFGQTKTEMRAVREDGSAVAYSAYIDPETTRLA